MRRVNFRYRPGYGIPQRWQEYVYAFGRMYCESPAVAEIVDSACKEATDEYAEALRKCVVCGISPRRVSCDYYVSERVIQYRLKRYYNIMYKKLKDRLVFSD